MYELNDRVIDFANYIIENNCTIRSCARHFNVAKSTVHFDLKYRLNKISKSLYNQVKEILVKNFNEKHIRGGESTRQKYLHDSSSQISL